MAEITDLAKLTPSAVSYLKNYAPLLKAAKEGYMGFDDHGLWVFQGNAQTSYEPYRNPHGTGTSAIVVSNDDSWSGGSEYSTAQFPLLQVLIYSDATRGADNTILKKDQNTKAWALYSIVDNVFHDIANQHKSLFGTTILRSVRGMPRLDTVPGVEGTVRLSVRYDMTLLR